MLEVQEWSAFSLEITFQEPAGFVLKSNVLTRDGAQTCTLTSPDGSSTTRPALACAEVIELSIPLADLGLAPGATVAFQIRLLENGLERECYPESVPIQFPLLTAESELENWIV